MRQTLAPDSHSKCKFNDLTNLLISFEEPRYENSLRMLNNLRTTTPTDPSEAGGSLQLGGVDQPLEMRHRMQNLTLNDMRSEDMGSVSSKNTARRQNRLKKRRFKEIDNAWELNMDADE